jgi:hypothetical protein
MQFFFEPAPLVAVFLYFEIFACNLQLLRGEMLCFRTSDVMIKKDGHFVFKYYK